MYNPQLSYRGFGTNISRRDSAPLYVVVEDLLSAFLVRK